MVEEFRVVSSRHCLDRAKERAGLNERRARKMINLAVERGITSEDCRWSVDRNYLKNKSDDTVEAIAYNGYCFIVDRESKSCITLFELPKRFGKKKIYYSRKEFLTYSTAM